MARETEIVCFRCGQETGHPLRLNRLANGETCPACRDRVLDALPALLPSNAPAEGARSASPEGHTGASHYDDEPPRGA